VELVVKKTVYIRAEALGLSADYVILLEIEGFSCRIDVDDEEENDNEQREYSVQKDKEGIISDYLIVDAKLLVPEITRFRASDVSAGEEVFKAHSEISSAEEYHIQREGALEKQIDDTADYLTAEKVTKTYKKVRGLGERVAVPEVFEKLSEAAPKAQEKGDNATVNPDEKADEALSDIFKKAFNLVEKPLKRCHPVIIEIH
jgi:adenylosuccinate synthase